MLVESSYVTAVVIVGDNSLFCDVSEKVGQARLKPQTSVYTLIRKSYGGVESEPKLTPREKSPLPEAQRRIEPTTLYHAGQQSQHATDELFRTPSHSDFGLSPF